MNLKSIDGAIARSWTARFAVAVMFILIAVAPRGFSADAPPMTEQQVKARCLLNFAKYIDWPSNAASTNITLRIGCVAEGKILDSLKEAAEGKLIGERKVQVVAADAPEAWAGCDILFVNSSERKRLPQILNRLKDLPVLVVGESDQFLQQGGAVNLLKKEGKVRFEINVDAARAAHLQISSKLLTLADNVQGKP